MSTIEELLTIGINMLSLEYKNNNKDSDDSLFYLNDFKIDSEVLLSSVLNKNRAYLKTWPKKEILAKDKEKYLEYINKRAKGEPVAYILGKQEFYGFKFIVDKNVLIPRPETEHFIEYVVENLNIDNQKILDLGVGSGALAITLATINSSFNITAVDKSKNALEIAKKNYKFILEQYKENKGLKAKMAQVNFINGNWFNNVSDTDFDLIVSNPPYVKEDDKYLKSDIRHEPIEALVSGIDGLDDLRLIVDNSIKHLKTDGYLFVEHGYSQGEDVIELFKKAGFVGISKIYDLSSIHRITFGQKK